MNERKFDAPLIERKGDDTHGTHSREMENLNFTCEGDVILINAVQ
jgi:hypothetical protein